ncbi:MAG: hypothetical protein HY321_13210 [Armatimonadetes bacterium]|nr:hypothetical protein [Armatimonadota bacterium]
MGTQAITVALEPETADRLERCVPPDEVEDFVRRAIKRQLDAMELQGLSAEMQECAREMHDEILAIERDFAPLEEEIHRQA